MRACLPSVLECKGRHDQCQYKEDEVKDSANNLVFNKQDGNSVDDGNDKENP